MKRIALIAAAAALPIVVVSVGLASQQLGPLQLTLAVETLSARAATDLDQQASQATRVPTTASERPLVHLRHPAPAVREPVRPDPAPAEKPAIKAPAIPAPPAPPKPARAATPVHRAPMPTPTPRLIPARPAPPAAPAPPTVKPVRPDLSSQALEDARRVLRTMPAAPARGKAQGRPGIGAHRPGAMKPGAKGRLFVKPHGKPRGPGHQHPPGHKQGRRPDDKRGRGLKPPRPPGLTPGKPPPPPPQPKPGVKPRPK